MMIPLLLYRLLTKLKHDVLPYFLQAACHFTHLAKDGRRRKMPHGPTYSLRGGEVLKCIDQGISLLLLFFCISIEVVWMTGTVI